MPRLELHELGERTLPSAIPLTPPIHNPAVVATTSHPLHGSGSGTYQGAQITIDAGTSFSLNGTVKLGSLGTFTVTGSVHGVGMLVSGRATGELVLSNTHGTITLSLHGGVQTAFSQPPSELVYVVSKGTGDFAHLSGYGTVGLHRTPAPTAPGMPPSGTVAITFS